MLKDTRDDRLKDQHIQLLRPEVLAAYARVFVMPVRTRRTRTITEDVPRIATDVTTIVKELPDELAE